MLVARVQPFLDVLMQHLSDLMVEADTWPDSAQVHLYAFWDHLDNLTQLLPLTQLPLQETRLHLSGLWQELDVLEHLPLYGDVNWHLDRVKKSLVYIAHIIDEHLCGYFELRSISTRTTELTQAV